MSYLKRYLNDESYMTDKPNLGNLWVTYTKSENYVYYSSEIDNSLCFTAMENNAIVQILLYGSEYNPAGWQDKSFYYKKNDDVEWTEWVFNNNESSEITLKKGDNLYVRSDSYNSCAVYDGNIGDYKYYYFKINAGKISASGNIMSLVNFTPVLPNYVFYQLFLNCTSLVSAPELPATVLSDYCYSNMFRGCTALTHTPELPATTLGDYCYDSMFRGCTSLISAPELPATALSEYCYSNMFRGCTSLTRTPLLIATTLTNNCYDSMFRGCTALTQTHKLPAPTLTNNCYSSMFRDCTSLTQAPALPATKLNNSCYSGMFWGCTSLTQAPELPATTLTEGCYGDMFSGCTSLTQSPELPATTLANNCYMSMFSGCTALTQAPILPATALSNSCYNGMFSGCTSLTQSPALPAKTLANNCYDSMFYGCTSLTVSSELPATALAQSCYQNMFYNCSKLNNITMFATDISASNCLNNWVYGVAASGIFVKATSMTSLTTGSSGIPSGWNVKKDLNYLTLTALGNGTITITIPSPVNSTHATSLSYSKNKSHWTDTIIDDTDQTITIPVSNGENVYLKGIAIRWNNTGTLYNSYINSTANINASGNIMSLLYGDNFEGKTSFPSGSTYTFRGLFSGNTHLVNAENLVMPATTLVTSCYQIMFWNCTSLTAAPTLPAPTLAYTSCHYMFKNCSKLSKITLLATNISAFKCLYEWVSGVAATGTFRKSAAMSSLPSGVSGIPNGWTVTNV